MEISFFKSHTNSDRVIEILKDIDHALAINQQRCFEVRGCCDARQGGKNSIAFSPSLNADESEEKLHDCIVLTESPITRQDTTNLYVTVDDARAVFIALLDRLTIELGLQPYTSIMSADISISPLARIHPSACLEEGVKISDGAVISAGCVIKRGTQIGCNTVIRENSVIGCDGITVYKNKNGDLMKFPHVCGVVIGENTEIGAGCVVARGILSSTRIGSNVVIGNLSNIGHGATVADDVWMSVGTLIGGHTHIGRKATIGMGSRIRDNQLVGDHASIGMGSVVVKSVDPGTSVFGNPAKRMATLTTGPKR